MTAAVDPAQIWKKLSKPQRAVVLRLREKRKARYASYYPPIHVLLRMQLITPGEYDCWFLTELGEAVAKSGEKSDG